MNKVQLSGRMGRDPEVRSTSSGGTITSASLATSNDYRDKSGQWVKKPASWHNLVAFGPVGEALARFHKGDILRVEGKITYDEWTQGREEAHHNENRVLRGGERDGPRE